jgi:hypothetical protein
MGSLSGAYADFLVLVYPTYPKARERPLKGLRKEERYQLFLFVTCFRSKERCVNGGKHG